MLTECLDNDIADELEVRDAEHVLSVTRPGVPFISDSKARKIAISAPIQDTRGDPVSLTLPDSCHSDWLDTILSPAVLVTRKELLQLVAVQLQLTWNKTTMTNISRCGWVVARHVTVTTPSGMQLHYWGSGTYERVRRGVSNLNPTWVEVEGYDINRNSRRRTSRLTYVVCGLQLTNVQASTGVPIPQRLHEVATKRDREEDKQEKDKVTFLLVRYAKAHPASRLRGPGHRPLCPGPLKNTHCLWTWATRSGITRGCFRTRPWSRHRQYFGSTTEEQDNLHQSDENAWYDLIQVTNVRCFANVQPDPHPDRIDVFLQSMVWS